MRPEPLKFRCDRCGQLLGVPAGRAGRSVTCPKCGAGLIVPDPAASAPGRIGPAGPTNDPAGRPPSAAEERPSGFFDSLELNPDDLRSLFPEDSGASPAPAESAAEASAAGLTPSAAGAGRSEGQGPERTPGPTPDASAGGDSGGDRPPIGDRDGPRVTPIPLIVEPDAGRLRAAEEPQSGAAPLSARMRSHRDVTIPRLAFLSWSLFVLVALFLAFVAGLLVGHFVWRAPA